MLLYLLWRQAGGSAERGRPTLLRADGTAPRVLVVDDEPALADLLSMALRYEGWEVRTAVDGLGAVRTARDFRPDAVVLDVMLPDIDGLEVLRRLRSDATEVPVLFLTARDAVEDRIAGITAGGDDYVTKPFSLEEVVARLRGLMRRASPRARSGRGWPTGWSSAPGSSATTAPCSPWTHPASQTWSRCRPTSIRRPAGSAVTESSASSPA